MKGALFGVVAVAVAAAIVSFGAAIVHVAAASPSSTAATVIHYKLVGAEDGAVGPDGRKHDTFQALDPTTVKLGEKVTIEVANYDDMMHGMSFPNLQINQMIAGGKEGQPSITRFTFTATKAGIFRWFCPVPCDGDAAQWAMTPDGAGKGLDQDQFMAGYISVS